ncbi:hypothetical protein NicSoilE8_43290 (plasmid) [Arthrobacter sp. NicSoilE8]|nr:hypothetical protein NicSoilE8_43290 [Arthrobacter sp. NicSoilE8]
MRLDRIEQQLGDGPCLEALQTLSPVLLPDTGTDTRWPLYSKALTAAGSKSVLGVPLPLGEDSSAALNCFAPDTGLFTDGVINEATVFAGMAAQALSLAVRISATELLVADLKSALESRTVIGMACGIIMEQNNCSPEQAFTTLLTASQHRNQKSATLPT